LRLRGPDAGPDFAAFAWYRELFDGLLIVNNGFDRETGDAVIEAGIADGGAVPVERADLGDALGRW